jgi:hypothetical protein
MRSDEIPTLILELAPDETPLTHLLLLAEIRSSTQYLFLTPIATTESNVAARCGFLSVSFYWDIQMN